MNKVNRKSNNSNKNDDLFELNLVNQTILSSTVAIVAAFISLFASFLNKKIIKGRLNDVDIKTNPTSSELSITSSEIFLIASIISADITFKRLNQKSRQNLTPKQISPFVTFGIAAVLLIISNALSLYATNEVAQVSDIVIIQNL